MSGGSRFAGVIRGNGQSLLVRRPDPKIPAARIQRLSRLRPGLAIVLGSGFNHLLGELDVDAEVSYAKLPGFPKPNVPGHEGKLVVGKLGGTPVIVLSGRAHFYEGYAMERVTFAVRTLAVCGITDLLLTNAAGGINRRFRAGDFMMLTDHINFIGVNPLRGPALPGRPRFVDLTEVYDANLRKMLLSAARAAKVRLQQGVYVAVSGPSYETPAEIRAFERLGGDAVGMSTVPEVIVARQCGMRGVALSCITNQAAGISKSAVSHEEVLTTGERVKEVGIRLLTEFARRYGQN